MRRNAYKRAVAALLAGVVGTAALGLAASVAGVTRPSA